MNNINLVVSAGKCTGCCECLGKCHEHSIFIVYSEKLGHPAPLVEDSDCNGCGECLSGCPAAKHVIKK